jgi:sporulation protein YlmC with PRC-barrel domain
MALVSLKDTYPDYRETFSDDSLSHLDDYSVYVDDDTKVGSVEDGLFDDATGQFRYLIVDTGVWIFGKKVLLPVGKADFDISQRRVYVRNLTKEQVERLPEYHRDKAVDYDYEESVRGIYREPTADQSVPLEGVAYSDDMPNHDIADLDMAVSNRDMSSRDMTSRRSYDRDTYDYDYDPGLYSMPQTEALNVHKETFVREAVNVRKETA